MGVPAVEDFLRARFWRVLLGLSLVELLLV